VSSSRSDSIRDNGVGALPGPRGADGWEGWSHRSHDHAELFVVARPEPFG
jgi:hypothetical protein